MPLSMKLPSCQEVKAIQSIIREILKDPKCPRNKADGLIEHCLSLYADAALLCVDVDKARIFLDELNTKYQSISDKLRFADDGENRLQAAIKRLDTLKDSRGWADIESLDTETASQQNIFPKNVFCDPVEKFINSVAAHSETDRAQAATAVLSTAAIASQGRFVVAHPSGNGHVEQLSLYTIILSESGTRKSSTFNEATFPIFEWAKKQRETYRKEFAAFTAATKTYEMQKEAANAKLRNLSITDSDKELATETLSNAELCLMNARDKAPKSPDIIDRGNITPEAIYDRLKSTGGTLGILAPEPDFFSIISGMYSKSGLVNIDAILCGYDGELLTRSRAGKETECISSPHISMCICAQPSAYEGFVANSQLSGRGFVARFLTAFPTSNLGERNPRNNKRIDIEARQRYTEKLVAILDSPLTSNPPVINWEDDAAEIMLDYIGEIEHTMKPGGSMSNSNLATAFASKSEGAVQRIAAILHLMECGTTPDTGITSSTARKAIKLHGYYFKAQENSMLAKFNREDVLLEKVLQRLIDLTIGKGTAWTSVSKWQQTCRKAARDELKTREDFDVYADILQNSGYCDIVHVEGSKRQIVYINPYILRDHAEAD